MSRIEATRLVIARELRESLRRKAIWIVAAILALGSTAAVVLPEILGGDSDSRTVGVVGAPSDEFGDTLREVASGVEIEIDLVDFDEREAATTAVRDGDVDAAAVLDVDPVAIVMPTDDDAELESLLRQVVGITSVVDALTDAGLTQRRDRRRLRQRRADGRSARHRTRRTPSRGLRDRRSCCTSCCCCSRRRWRVAWRSRRPTA